MIGEEEGKEEGSSQHHTQKEHNNSPHPSTITSKTIMTSCSENLPGRFGKFLSSTIFLLEHYNTQLISLSPFRSRY
jgi:hypothetical protein